MKYSSSNRKQREPSMRKRDSIDSESDDETSEEAEEEDGDDGKIRSDGATEYEKERLSRMAENRARMEALGLRKMASSLMAMVGSSHSRTTRNKKSKGKRVKVDEDDGDYIPEDERPQSSSSEEEKKNEEEDGDGNNGHKNSNSKRKSSVSKKDKMTVSNWKKKASVRKVSNNTNYIDDDEALKKVIALSLQESELPESSDMVIGSETKGKKQSHEDSEKNKRKKSFVSRVLMTEDELLLHFYQFDENWNDGISVRDLERVAIQHDFTWTDKELAEMIRYFDSDGDGKVSLEDFRKIAMRCKMIKGNEDS